MATFISDHFNIDADIFEQYGILNISIVNDLPLFIDPFLLFHSEKSEYVKLHESMINYLVFLRDRAAVGSVSDGDLLNWYCFKEVKQNWLGFSVSGNGGAGLGMDFARNLHANLNVIFSNFGEEQITESSHLEKVCLVSDGVGRDNISDFTTNLIKDYLCQYTAEFAAAHLPSDAVKDVLVERARFNYMTQSWERVKYKLPWINGDYVILTPKDILTCDENWINKKDLIEGFENVPTAIPDAQLRSAVSNYFELALKRSPKKPGRRQVNPTQEERSKAAVATMRQFPEIIDFYIRLKEQNGDDASDVSAEKVLAIEYMFIEQLRALQALLVTKTKFYEVRKSTYDEAHARLSYLKDVIENKGGHRLFYDEKGAPIEREKDLHVLYRLVWFGTPSDFGAEANDGRGPVDFKVSRGTEKTLVEMKLAKNTKLAKNLAKQVEIYQSASDAKTAIKAIIYFTEAELSKVRGILKDLRMTKNPDVVLIDARRDNKPSASNAS